MQMMKPPKSGAVIVWTSGALASVCFCIILLVMERFVSPGSPFAEDTFGRFHITSIILSWPFWLASILASRQTGRVSTGIRSILVAELLLGIIYSAVVVMAFASNHSPSETLAAATATLQDLATDPLVLLIFIGAGLLLGLIGGLIGYLLFCLSESSPSTKSS